MLISARVSWVNIKYMHEKQTKNSLMKILCEMVFKIEVPEI